MWASISEQQLVDIIIAEPAKSDVQEQPRCGACETSKPKPLAQTFYAQSAN